MTEQITPPRDEGQQPEPEVGAQPSGQPSQAPPGWSPSAGYVTPGMAGPGHLAGPPEQAPDAGQPGELGQAADVAAQGTGPPPTRSRDRKVIVIAAAAVVLIAVGTVLGIVLSSGSSGQSFPSTLLGLARDTSPDAQQAAGQISSGMGVLQGLIVHPGAAVYGSGPDQGVIVATGQWSDAAKADGLISNTPGQAKDGLKSQSVTDAALFPAGPRGGSLACGHKTIDGQSSVICMWADSKMFGVTFYFGSASSLSDAAVKTIQVRSAVEH
jgi:hypothetical protein